MPWGAFMIKSKTMAIAILVTLFTFLSSLSPSFADTLDGEYQISGRSVEQGDYSGTAVIKGKEVQRFITWKDFSYEGNSVESIWAGTLVDGTIRFSLTLSHTLTSFNGFSPDEDEFKKPIEISIPINSLNSEFSIFAKGDGQMTETWTKKDSTNLETSSPWWTNLRKMTVGIGGQPTWVKLIAKWSGLMKIVESYRNHPDVKKYEKRAEFQGQKQYFFDDKTDADFYAKNPNALRLANKTLNPLALAEAEMKKNAYGKTLKDKENFLRTETFKYNLNSAGLVEFAVVDEAGNKIGTETEYDSALWSSMLGWAEVLRYQTTKDPEALQHFKTILSGVLTLLDITNDPKEFARSLVVSPANEVMPEGWFQGTAPYSHLKWRKGGNNDMAKGLFITLTLAHQVLDSSDALLIERIKKVSARLSDLNAVKKGYNLAMAKGLDALWNGNNDSYDVFTRERLSITTFLGDVTNLGVGIYVGGIADWSGIHLSTASTGAEVLLARELQKVYPYNPVGYKARQVENAAQRRLEELDHIYRKAHRDFITIFSYALSKKEQRERMKDDALKAVWTLKDFPAPRSLGDAEADLKKLPNWSMSAWPRLPWKGLDRFGKLNKELPYDEFFEGAYGYPNFEGPVWSSPYIWKDNPFDMSYQSRKNIKSYSADYLIVYWLGKSSGLIGEAE
jgi:hypothetical protein